MTACPVHRRGFTVCGWNLVDVAEERGLQVHVSTFAPADPVSAVRFVCPHGNPYWIIPADPRKKMN